MQKVQGFVATAYVYVSKQELRSIKRHLKNQMSFMMNLYMHVVQCFLRSVRNDIISIVFQGQSYLLQVILSQTRDLLLLKEIIQTISLIL